MKAEQAEAAASQQEYKRAAEAIKEGERCVEIALAEIRRIMEK